VEFKKKGTDQNRIVKETTSLLEDSEANKPCGRYEQTEFAPF